MQESARAALSYVRTRAELYGAEPDFYEKKDIHVHIPEGAIPKDGPSAGITMATSILSAVTNIACRKDLAMTGEITLRGKVLPVGGIKEKLLAAYRAGITTIVLPRENEKDLDDLPEEIRNVMEFHLVEDVEDRDPPGTAACDELEESCAEGGLLHIGPVGTVGEGLLDIDDEKGGLHRGSPVLSFVADSSSDR